MLEVGDSVENINGIRRTGEILVIFTTLDGHTRCVVEDTFAAFRGSLNIYARHELRPVRLPETIDLFGTGEWNS